MTISRLFYLALFIICLSLLGFGLYLEHAQGIEPCPLCSFQRIAYITNGKPRLPALANMMGGHKLRGSILRNLEVTKAIKPDRIITRVIASAKPPNRTDTPPRSIRTLKSRQGMKTSIFRRLGKVISGLNFLA